MPDMRNLWKSFFNIFFNVDVAKYPCLKRCPQNDAIISVTTASEPFSMAVFKHGRNKKCGGLDRSTLES